MRAQSAAFRASRLHTQGDPHATRTAILELIDADEPPLRVFFGDGSLAIATADYEQRLATWRQWEPLSLVVHGNLAAR